MKNLTQFGQAFKAFTLAGLCFLLSNMASAQTTAANDFQPSYLLREYMKVEPGKWDDYLKTEQVWKKVHQRRIVEGKIVDWNLFRRVYPSGSATNADYMTVTVFENGKEAEEANNMSWDYITKGMSKEDLAIADNTGKTRKFVTSELIYLLNRVQPVRNAKFYQFTNLKAMPGKGVELETYEKMMQPVFEEAVQMGKISGWRFGERLYPHNQELGNYYRAIATTTLDDMLKANSSNYIEVAFKKVYPNKDYAATMKTIRELITILDVELWELVELK